MANNYFSFKQFTIRQDKCAFKVGTDGVLLGAYADVAGAKRILDIGTGTGLIALMLAQRCEAEIAAIEPDRDSYEQACSNIESSRWSSRVKAENTYLQNFKPAGIRFDLIVTNPPFFTNSLKNPDPVKAAARHKDTLSSDELLKGVTRLMAEDGRLQVIMPYAEGNIFIAEAQAYGLYCNNILKIKPLPSSEVMRLILTFSRHRQKVKESFLTIEHGARHDFTELYINLTKDFYLKF
jgi:tRNA1Val (adenine37-N6)-methyltransferase